MQTFEGCKSESKEMVKVPCQNHRALAVRRLSMEGLLASGAKRKNQTHSKAEC